MIMIAFGFGALVGALIVSVFIAAAMLHVLADSWEKRL